MNLRPVNHILDLDTHQPNISLLIIISNTCFFKWFIREFYCKIFLAFNILLE